MVGGLRIGKRLKNRLTAAEVIKRKNRMEYRSNTHKQIAINRGGLNALAEATLVLANRQKRLWWFLGGLSATTLGLAARIAGLW